MTRPSHINRTVRTWLLIAFTALVTMTCWGLGASKASAVPTLPEGLGLKYLYTYSSCTSHDTPIDPINVVWYGSGSSPDQVGRVLRNNSYKKWEWDDLNGVAARLGSPGRQSVYYTNGGCAFERLQRATEFAVLSRLHVRLFQTSGSGSVFTVGDAHHDKLVSFINGCSDGWIKPVGHAADSFNVGRDEIAKIYTNSQMIYWGNTYELKQCNGKKTKSDGYVLYANTAPYVGRAAGGPDEYANLTVPAISGTTRPGFTLTVNPGTWSPASSSFIYEWCRVDTGEGRCVPYPGATGATWTPPTSAAGDQIGVLVRPVGADPEEAVLSNVVQIAGAPRVSALPATEVKQRSVVLTGLVYPQGQATKYYFQWGYSSSYEKTIPAPPGTDIGAGSEGVEVKNQISGLEKNQIYHYRVVATNAEGAFYSDDREFRTMAAIPASATTEPASEIAPTAATLNGTVNPNGDDTQYSFEYGKTSSPGYEWSIPMPSASVGSGVNPLPVSQRLTGLKSGTTYRYRLNAWNSSYGGPQSAEMTFTTVGPGVETLPAGEVTQSKITMPALVNGAGLPTTYWFEYGINDAYGSKTEVKNLPLSNAFQSVSATLEGLPVGWTVHYRIVASSSEGTNAGEDQVVTTAWKQEPAEKTRDGVASVSLNDVSCSGGEGDCVAVGSYLNRDPYETRVAASFWNGREWKTVDPPNPSDGFYAELSGVSCTSVTNCLAVGTVLTGNGSLKSRALGMRWNGSSWTEIALPQPPAGLDYQLTDISCPAENSCEAVGLSANTYKPDQSAEAKPLALHWDGTSWTQRSTAAPGGEAGSEGLFMSVSCATTTFCKAVGRRSPVGANVIKGLIESLSGSAWVNEAPETVGWPQGEANFRLEGVSCPTSAACVAVGSSSTGSSDSSPKKAFTQNWNGTQWLGSIYRMRDEANMATELYDVSCSSATSCRAVGKKGRAAQWTGTQWRLEAPKGPADVYSLKTGTPPLVLNGIACPTAIECHAVGSYLTNGAGSQRLAQEWSGEGAVPGAGWTDANNITETGATFRGAVNPAGVDASYYFEYGLTESYGSKTAEGKAGSNNLGTNSANWTIGYLPASGLQAGQKYHYRLVVTNGTSTVYSADRTFETKSILNEMSITEAFNGGTSTVSDFATKWAPLQWTGAAHKGKNNANGYGPVDTAANGAYFIPPVTDPGFGVAAQAKIATGPGVGGRISLWLHMTNPATEKRGYELCLVETAANVYSIEIKRFFGATEKVLASASGYSLPAGSRIALVDSGPTVAVWASEGSGWKSVASAADTVFSGGNAAIEVQGSTATRVTEFKFGIRTEKLASADAALKAFPVADEFSRTESPLSLSGSWVALPWATAAVKTGKVDPTAGWTPTEWSTITGAYWQKAMASDTGNGDAVQITSNYSYLNNSPSLWLNMPNPAAAKSGYQLKVVGTGGWQLELKLFKWVNGTPTQLGSNIVSFPNGSVGARFALVDKGGTVSVWYWRGGSGDYYAQALSAADTTYSYGYAGIEGNGPTGMKKFSLGQLPAY